MTLKVSVEGLHEATVSRNPKQSLFPQGHRLLEVLHTHQDEVAVYSTVARRPDPHSGIVTGPWICGGGDKTQSHKLNFIVTKFCAYFLSYVTLFIYRFAHSLRKGLDCNAKVYTKLPGVVAPFLGSIWLMNCCPRVMSSAGDS